MDWGKLGSNLLNVVPIIGTAIGGPVGAAASAVAGLVGAALGVEPDPISISQALSNDPDAYVKLKQLESDERTKLIEYQTIQLQAELANIISARNREVELAKAGHGASWGTSIVSIIISVGFFIMLYIVIDHGETAVGEAGLLMLGTLAAAFGGVVNYYLGSSLGSMSKDKMLLQASPSKK